MFELEDFTFDGCEWTLLIRLHQDTARLGKSVAALESL